MHPPLKHWYTDPVYLMLLSVTGLLFIFSTGFIWGDPFGLHAFSHLIFKDICHQFPWRSFSVDQMAMAACSRCFGLYAGCFVAAVIIPFFRLRFSPGFRSAIILLGITAGSNTIDIAGNLIGLWSNTLYSRFVLGLLFGAAVLYIILIVYKPNNKHQNLWNLSNNRNHIRIPR